MSGPLVVMDVGDVLIRTVPMAHHRELARRSELGWRHVADTIEASGAVAAFERGKLSVADFAATVRRLLSRPRLGEHDIREAWNSVVAEPDDVLAPLAARLAAAGRLLLASNTNPYHWQLVHARLADVGVHAPACLSFGVGYAKPDPRFSTALRAVMPRSDRQPVYIDDRPENVEAAVRCGWAGWVHREPTSTAGYLLGLLD